jgi:hypothetical protein
MLVVTARYARHLASRTHCRPPSGTAMPNHGSIVDVCASKKVPRRRRSRRKSPRGMISGLRERQLGMRLPRSRRLMGRRGMYALRLLRSTSHRAHADRGKDMALCADDARGTAHARHPDRAKGKAAWHGGSRQAMNVGKQGRASRVECLRFSDQ